MAPTLKDLGIDQLNVQQRLSLALEIWESLGDELPSPTLTPSQIEQLRRRDAEMDADPGIALTWEQIRTRVEGRL